MKDGRKYKSMIAFTKEMKAYGSRTNNFQYIPRQNNHSTGFFRGVGVASKWDSDFDNPPALPAEMVEENDEDIL